MVVRNPPYEYAWVWHNAWNNPDPRAVIRTASTDGTIHVFVHTNDRGPSSTDARGHIGIYFRPTASGMYSFSVSPAVSAHYSRGGSWGAAETVSWSGIFGMKFNASNGAYDGVIFDVPSASFGGTVWYLAGFDSISFDNSGLSLNAQFQADTNHYYALCVYCIARARGDGFGGLFSGSGGDSTIDANVPWMIWDQLG